MENNIHHAGCVGEKLKESGFNVSVVSDKDQVEHIFLKEKPHILLLDINISQRKEIELIQFVKKYDKNFPIVIYSACSDTETVIKLIEAGVVDYIYKSDSIKILIAKLNSIYKRHYNPVLMPEFYRLSEITTFDYKAGVLSINNVSVKLRPMDCCLLKLLSCRLNEWADADYLSMGMWHVHDKVNELRRYMLRLRRILKADSSLEVENKWGGFYRLKN